MNNIDELSYYKSKYNEMSNEISKYEAEIKKLESSNKKLQELVSKNAQNINNTSIAFFLPSEFKNLWDKLIKTELLEAFDSYINDYVTVSNLSQDLFLITYKETEELIHKKINAILECLNIKNTSKEQMNKIISKFLPFFQEHLFEIFNVSQDIESNIKKELIKIASTYKSKIDIAQLSDEIDKEQFKMLLSSLFSVSLYMLLHDPILTLAIEPYQKRTNEYMYYNKKDMIIIEGFPMEMTPCMLILPPPMLRKKFPFNGMKPAYYALNESDQNIINECERKKKESSTSKSTANTPIESKISKDYVEIEGSKSGAKSLNNNKGFILMNGLISTNKKKELILDIPSDKEDDNKQVVSSSTKNKDTFEIPSYTKALMKDNSGIDNIFNKANNSNYYDFKLNSERTNSRKKYELPNSNTGNIPSQTVNTSYNLYLTNTNSVPNINRPSTSHILSFNNSIQPQLIPKKNLYHIPSFNIVRNKEIRSRSKEKENSDINYYQYKKRETYTPYHNSNDSSFRYSNYLTNNGSNYMTSNKYISNEMKVNELKMKYHINNESSETSHVIENGIPIKPSSPKYNIPYDKFYYKKY